MSYASNKIPSPSKNPLVTNDNAKANENDDFTTINKQKKSSRYLREIQAEGTYLWEITKYYLSRPAVAGGLFGIVNIGLLAFAGRKFYRHPHLRRDATAVSASFAACIILMTIEGYTATKYRQMLQNQGRKMKKGGTVVFRQFSGHIGSLGRIAGLVNTVVLGAVGYWSYLNWNKPWDRRTVSAFSVGLLALWSGEEFLAKR